MIYDLKMEVSNQTRVQKFLLPKKEALLLPSVGNPPFLTTL